MTRQEIFAVIEAERKMQDVTWGGEANDDTHDEKTWCAILSKHLGKASETALDVATQEALHAPSLAERYRLSYRRRLIKIAALAVANIEAMDRKSDAKNWKQYETDAALDMLHEHGN